jgi:hypothetical protein
LEHINAERISGIDAALLGIAQPTYAKQEASNTLRKSSREKIAIALGITAAQLDF